MQHFTDEELKETNASRKIHAHWEKEYDIEQVGKRILPVANHCFNKSINNHIDHKPREI